MKRSEIVASAVRRIGLGTLLCAVALGGLVTAASAAPDGPGAPGAMHRPMMHHHLMHQLKHLRAQLKLSDSQSQLWDAALEKMHPPHDMAEHAREHHHHMMEALKDPGFDPHQMADAMDKMREQEEAHMKEVRDAWLAVWDALDADQRTKVRHFMLRMHSAKAHHASAAPDAAKSAPAAPSAAPAATAPAPAAPAPAAPAPAAAPAPTATPPAPTKPAAPPASK